MGQGDTCLWLLLHQNAADRAVPDSLVGYCVIEYPGEYSDPSGADGG